MTGQSKVAPTIRQRPNTNSSASDRRGATRKAAFAGAALRLHGRSRFLLRSTTLMGMMALLAGVTPERAPAFDGTVIVPDTQASPWNTSSLVVGDSGVATLIIQDGGVVNNSGTTSAGDGIIGRSLGSQGDVTVSGAGSTWTNSRYLYVGYSGTGTLTVSDGGAVSSGNYLYVGYSGGGTLNITNGGTVSGTGRIYIGNNPGTVGTVTVSGPGSALTTGTLIVGQSGTAILTIADGATVTATSATSGTYVMVPAQPSGSGTINIGAAQGDAAVAPGTLNAPNASLGARGSLVFNHTDTSGGYLFAPLISGAGVLTQVAGVTTLTANNTYTGGTTILGGTLQLGTGGTTGWIAGNVVNDGMLTFNRSDARTFDGVISGTGAVSQIGAGTLTLTGANSYAGATTVNRGILNVSGSIASSAMTTVSAGATLTGTGTVGNATIAFGGTLTPGGADGTVGILTIDGNLVFNDGSILNSRFGQQAGIKGTLLNQLVVTGDLTLDGTLSTVLPGGYLAPGMYRIIDYRGMLYDNGLDLDPALSSAGLSVGTAIAGQVDLIYTTAGMTFDFWDGAVNANSDLIDGGNGTWRAAGDSNWTDQDSAANRSYTSGSFAVFAGAAGTVTVDNGNGPVVSGGMQFVTSGYVIEGDPITLANGENIIRVGDGSAAGAGYMATIASELTGDGGIDKTDAGTLVLTGANSYTGGTTISDGTLRLGDGGTDGAIVGDVVNNGSLVFNRADAFTLDGVISGNGVVNQIGPGTTTLTGDNSYTGGTTISAGALVLTGANTYTGGTTISGGALQLGDGGDTGSIVGNVLNNGTLVFNRNNTLTYGGVISGSGVVNQIGPGITALSGGNSYTGGTIISAGTLRISGDSNLGAVSGALTLDGGTLNTTATFASARAITLGAAGGTFAVNSGTTLTLSGAIAGAGALIKADAGTLALTGVSNYFSGITSVTGGTVLVNGTFGNTASAVVVSSGGTLGGGTPGVSGIIGGSVSIADGGILAPGGIGTVGTLTINGDLTLGAGSILNYQFGQAGTVGGTRNDLTVIGGDLTLDGTLNVTVPSGGSFTTGLYRLFNYAGELTDQGLDVGLMPDGGYFSVITSIDGQVNLIYSDTPVALTFWDGDDGLRNDHIADGGDGTWHTTGDNWMNPYLGTNGPYENPSLATFGGAAGTVTVDNSSGTVSSSGMLFVTDGYVIQGDPIALTTGDNVIQVGDGTTAGAGYVATINSELTGAGGINKTDLGSLVLTGDNSYTGTTTISKGTLQIGDDKNLGDQSGGLTFDGGTLNTTATFASARATTLATGGGTFKVDAETTLTMGGVISGVGALGKTDAGTLLLTGDSNYSGGTTISGGTLQLGSGGTTGSITGNVLNNGILTFNHSDSMTFDGVISGTGLVNQIGSGTTILTGANSYSGLTTISAGTLQLGDGGTTGIIVGDVLANSILAFNRSDTLTYGGVISGTGAVNQIGGGVTILTGNSNAFAGAAGVTGGVLLVNGTLGNVTSAVVVSSGGTLGGIGAIGGNVTIYDNGILSPGGLGTVGTLTIGGNLSLNDGSILDYQFGQAGVVGGPFNDLTVVGGNLTLDGTLNVTAPGGGSFDPGVYRIFSYGGTLNNNVLDVGTTPAGSYFVIITSIDKQVDLVYSATALTLNFWDGDNSPGDGFINGGDGLWRIAAGDMRWTNQYGSANGPYENASFAVFAGVAGTVTVDNSGDAVVESSGMQFMESGYVIEGDAVTLVDGNNIIRVGDGTAAGADYVATINSELTGDGGIKKTDLGTLVLTGDNSYAGDTTISGGTLQIGKDSNLGDASGTLIFDGGTLNTTATFASARATTLATGGGTFDVNTATTLTMSGVISGAGALSKTNAGTLLLTGDNNYSGGTTISSGTLQLGDGGTTGSIAGNVLNNGILAFNRSDALTYGGTISGTGLVNQIGSGTTILTGANSYSGLTTISAGTLQLGDGGTTGAIVGDVLANSILAFNRSDTLTYDGVISGTGAVNQIGGGTTVLTGNSGLFSGVTGVAGGVLLVNGTLGNATSAVAVSSGGTLGGLGVIGGHVSVASGGTLAPGGAETIGALTIEGNLELNNWSILNYRFGQVGMAGGLVNDLTVVKGNLTLDGILNIADLTGGAFDPGIYRIISYDGALTNNGLALGAAPSTDFIIATAIAGQVDLIHLTTGMILSFWDGPTGYGNIGFIDGGSGTWQVANVDSNWTDENGSGNGGYANGSFAVFAGDAGIVTVDNDNGHAPVVSSGMQFVTSGYVIEGDAITLVDDENIIRVGDGSVLGTGYVATINSELTGDGGINKTDVGTLVLTGDNSYTGGTTISDGVLKVGKDGNLGDASGTLTFDGGALKTTDSFASERTTTLAAGGGTFLVDADTTLTMGGVLSGSGHLNKADTGTLALTADNTYSGGTTISEGTLRLGNGGTTGAIVGDVVNDGALAFNRSDHDLTIDGVISGSGTVNQIGAGATTLTGDNTYTGGTTISGGTLQVSKDGNLGDKSATLTFDGGALNTTDSFVSERTTTLAAGGGAFLVDTGTTLTMGGAISGAGALTKADAGTLVLTGNNTYTGGTTISGGTLQVSKDGNLGDKSATLTFDGGALNTTNSFVSERTTTLAAGGGAFLVDAGTTLTMGGAISGAGTLTKADAGTLVLTGNNTYTGGTTISGGTLQLGNGGATGSIVGDVANNGTLAFNRSDTVSFGGVISGAGAVNQIGPGTLTLTGINSYTGETTVSGGTLNVIGSIASSVMTTVDSGAVLTGSGSVGNTTITGGGTFAPGNGTPGSSMTVAGNLSLQSGSRYVTWLGPDTSSLADVRGTATLGGATVNAVYADGDYVKKRYTILTAANGVSGSFNGLVNTNLPKGFQPSLAYDANNAYLNLNLSFGPPEDLDDNQKNVGDSLSDYFDTSGGIPGVFGQLMPDQLAQIAGELPTASRQATFDAMSQFMGLMNDRFIARCGDSGSAPVDDAVVTTLTTDHQGWTTWTVAYGGERNTDGNAVTGSHDTMSRVYGVAAGADYHISPGSLAGFALASGGTKFEIAGGRLGSGSSDLLQAGVFARHKINDAYVGATVAYGWQDITTERMLTIIDTDQLRANFHANAFSGRLESGYRFDTVWAGVTPYAAGQFITYHLPDYGERVVAGRDLFALNYESKSVTAWRSELGLRADRSFTLAAGRVTVGGTMAWAHNFDNERRVTAELQTLPGASFEVNGAAIAEDAALLSTSLEMAWRNGWSIAAVFDGEFSGISQVYAGSGLLLYRW